MGNETKSHPEGLDFINIIQRLEVETCEASDAALRSLGKRLPDTFSKLGTVLSLLDRLAANSWGKINADQIFECIGGRVCNLAWASVRLTRAGYYDESFALIRTLAETANLFNLFVIDATEVARWKQTPAEKQWSHFGATKVREAIEKRGGKPPFTKEHYKLLSGLTVHTNSKTAPQKFNVVGRPSCCVEFQSAGLVSALNELSLTVAVCTASLANLIGVPQPAKSLIIDASTALVEAAGIRLQEVLEKHEDMRKSTNIVDDLLRATSNEA